jgi:2-dehydropantoate 2-reductase
MRHSSAPSVAIVGAGAIGGLFATQLRKHGFAVTLVARNKTVADWLNRHGITIIQKSRVERWKVKVVPVEELVPADVLVLAVKIFDLPSVFRRLKSIADTAREIVCVQSSLRLTQYIPDKLHNKTLAAAMMVAASGGSGGLIFTTGHRRIYLGGAAFASSSDQIAVGSVVLRNIAEVKVTDPVLPQLIAKVSLNVATFPFSVAGRCSFGAAFRGNKRAVRFAAAVLRDCARLARAVGVEPGLKFASIEVSALSESQERAESAIRWLIRNYSDVIPSSVFDQIRGKRSELPCYFDDIIELAANARTPVDHVLRLRAHFDDMIDQNVPIGPDALEWLSAVCA